MHVSLKMAHTTNFKSLKELAICLGNSTLPRLAKAKNLNYESEMTMQEMVRAIHETVEEDIIKEAALSPHYSLIFDEATDVSVHKQLGLCIQHINPSGKVVARNLKLLELQQGKGDHITQAILQYISASQLDLQKMAGGASDGAAVMVGHVNGVMTQLKGVVPLFIATHCAAHRLSLAVSQACETVPCAKRFERLINQIHVCI